MPSPAPELREGLTGPVPEVQPRTRACPVVATAACGAPSPPPYSADHDPNPPAPSRARTGGIRLHRGLRDAAARSAPAASSGRRARRNRAPAAGDDAATAPAGRPTSRPRSRRSTSIREHVESLRDAGRDRPGVELRRAIPPCRASAASRARKSTAAPSEHDVPQLLVRAALSMKSSNGKSYAERIAAVRTERELSLVYEDFIGRVPMGRRLFADCQPGAHGRADAGQRFVRRGACARTCTIRIRSTARSATRSSAAAAASTSASRTCSAIRRRTTA